MESKCRGFTPSLQRNQYSIAANHQGIPRRLSEELTVRVWTALTFTLLCRKVFVEAIIQSLEETGQRGRAPGKLLGSLVDPMR